MSNYTSKKWTYKDKKIQAQEERKRSINALKDILFLIGDLDQTDRITLIHELKKSDDFKDIIEKENN